MAFAIFRAQTLTRKQTIVGFFEFVRIQRRWCHPSGPSSVVDGIGSIRPTYALPEATLWISINPLVVRSSKEVKDTETLSYQSSVYSLSKSSEVEKLILKQTSRHRRTGSSILITSELNPRRHEYSSWSWDHNFHSARNHARDIGFRSL